MMEYMNRVVEKWQGNPNYNHHSNCERLGITHLYFADDVLLFPRGDYQSVELILATFKEFADSTGLKVNPQKCKLFYSGMEENIIQRVKQLTGFTNGSLLVRYLGVPLTCKKQYIVHYFPLVERIISNIRHWTTKLLSIVGRIQLVNSVSLDVTQYWMNCFHIPKGVIHKTDSICRAFI